MALKLAKNTKMRQKIPLHQHFFHMFQVWADVVLPVWLVRQLKVGSWLLMKLFPVTPPPRNIWFKYPAYDCPPPHPHFSRSMATDGMFVLRNSSQLVYLCNIANAKAKVWKYSSHHNRKRIITILASFILQVQPHAPTSTKILYRFAGVAKEVTSRQQRQVDEQRDKTCPPG